MARSVARSLQPLDLGCLELQVIVRCVEAKGLEAEQAALLDRCDFIEAGLRSLVFRDNHALVDLDPIAGGRALPADCELTFDTYASLTSHRW